jgi:chemotaxis methyl-accepting protein methylase
MVVVSAKELQYRDRIVTRVVGNKLEIYFNNKGFSIRSDMRLKAYVSFKQLNMISASGSSDVFVNGIVKGDKLEIHINGSSDLAVQLM